MARFILVRHGQTELNREHRFRGRSDVPLNATGIAQARALASALAGQGFAAVYSSPLRRALDTARIIAEPLPAGVRVLEELTDIDCGRWEGRSTQECVAEDARLYQRWLQAPHTFTFPGGESLAQVRQRALDAFSIVLGMHQDGTVALVTHSAVCRVLLGEVLGMAPARFWQLRQSNGALSVVELHDDTLSVLSINDTCHLRSPGAKGNA